jgi:hypothetical protein
MGVTASSAPAIKKVSQGQGDREMENLRHVTTADDM